MARGPSKSCVSPGVLANSWTRSKSSHSSAKHQSNSIEEASWKADQERKEIPRNFALGGEGLGALSKSMPRCARLRIWDSTQMGCRAMAGWLSGEKRCKRDRKCPSTLSGTLREDLEEMGPCNGVAESSERHGGSNGELGSTCQANGLHQLITAK